MSVSFKVIILIFLSAFISCAPRNLDESRSSKRKSGKSMANFETLHFLYIRTLTKIAEDYSKIVEDYKEDKDELEEQIETYNKMIEVSYEINKKYSQYIENKVLVKEDLIKIQSQIGELSESLESSGASDEVKSMLESIKMDLENLIEQAMPMDIDWELVESAELTEGTAVVELEEGSAESGDSEEVSMEGEEALDAEGSEEASMEGDAVDAEGSEESGDSEEAPEQEAEAPMPAEPPAESELDMESIDSVIDETLQSSANSEEQNTETE